MSEDARGKRGYDSPARRARAAVTRRRIIDAAAAEFLDRGYIGATIPMIATRAGVAVETVYRSATGKAGLLASAVQVALAGGHERAELPVEQRGGIRAVIDAPDAADKLAAYAATQPGVWSRVGPLLAVLDEAAPAQPDLAALRTDLAQQRLDGMRRFAQLLASEDALQPGLSPERAADVLWTVCAQATFDALVRQRGWSADQYRTWLADTLAAILLKKPTDVGKAV